MRLVSWLTASIPFLLCTATASSQSVCDKAIDKGAFREETLIDNSEFKREVLDWACNSSEAISTKTREIGLKIPLPKILGANYNTGTGSVNKAAACSDKSARSSEQIATNITKKFADKDLLKAWLSCTESVIESERSGLSCRAKADNDDPEQITITVNWRPTSATQLINLSASTRNLHCEGFVGNGVAMSAFDSKIYLCSRPDITRPSSIAVNTNAPGSRCDLRVDAVIKPTDDDLVRKCFKNVEDQYPGGIAGNMAAGAKMRMCDQMQITRTDLTISKLGESQWKRCIDMFDNGKDEAAKRCVEANTIPGFEIRNNWRTIAERGYNEAVTRRVQSEEMIRSIRNKTSSD